MNSTAQMTDNNFKNQFQTKKKIRLKDCIIYII